MVHNAYDLNQLVKVCPAKIESVASWGCRLLFGCIDGSLRIYVPESMSRQNIQNIPSDDSDGSGIITEAHVLERTVVGFAKKAVMSMDVLHSRRLLLSLSDAITLHRLPEFEVVAYIGKTKGASLYAWDDKRGFLCVNKQKKLFIYRYDGSREFVEVKEFSVPDVVKSMAWCGDNLCLGIRREYVIMNTLTGAFFEVFPCGRSAPPLVVSLPSGELLLGKDNIGVFVDHNGKLLQEGRICWSEAPASVAIHSPYAIARLPRHIEIRSLRAPYQLVQTFSLRDVHLLLSSSNCVVAAFENSASGLFPVPIGAQVVQLAASGNFEEALALCKLLPQEDLTLRASKEDSIRIRYGQYLFDNGSYEEAMQQFSASSLDIAMILSLYPSIKLPKTSSVSSSENIFESSSDTLSEQHIVKISSDPLDEVEGGSLSASQALSSQNEENRKTHSQKPDHNSLTALIKFLLKKRKNIIGKAAAEDTDEVVAAVVEDASASVDTWRSRSSMKSGNSRGSGGAREIATILDTALVQALLLTGQSGVLELLQGPNYCDVKICGDFMLQRGHYSELIELYKYNEMHREALKLLNQLVAGLDSLPVPLTDKQTFGPQSIIEYLKPLGGLNPALVLDCSTWILEACPEQTIELFSSTDPPLPPNLVNSYLKQHSPHMQATYLEHMLALHESAVSSSLQNELVQIFLAKVLDEYTELRAQGKWDERQYSTVRQKLLSALENTSGYNPEVLLKRLPPDALYEERAFLLGKMQQHELALTLYAHKLHEPELALCYCDRIYLAATLVINGKMTSSPGALHQPDQRASVNIYLTLLQVYLNPQKSTKEFDRTIATLTSFRGPVTQKIGFAHKVKGHVAKKIAEIEGPEDIIQSLSSTDSAPESGRSDGEESTEGGKNMEGMMLNEALNLLSRRWDRINGAQALRLLPSDTKLQQLLPFLEPLLKKSSEARRNLSVIKSLRHSENLQVKDELYKSRKRVVKISSESTCSLCNKRIGSSVFAVYPNGTTLVHFVCFRDSQTIKAVAAKPNLRAL